MRIKILQWNVWVFEKKENILELLKEFNPDIVCLQELTIGSTFQDGVNVAEFLAAGTGFNQFHKAIPNLAPSECVGDLANGILSRFPIISTDWKWVQEPENGGKTYDDQFRMYVEATISTGADEVTIGTVHLSYTDRFKGTPQQKIEADNLLEIIRHKKQKYVITGDFNSPPESELIGNVGE